MAVMMVKNVKVIGRFAPSPTGPLHVGNLRTALIAWLSARQSGGVMLLRYEDLDRANSSAENEDRQITELAKLGIVFDTRAIRQSERFDIYRGIVEDLRQHGLVYPCFCTRREILEAPQAPHGPSIDGAYAGTCRELTRKELSERQASGRPPAWRLRTNHENYVVHDLVAGPTNTTVDDMVLMRNDGVPAYNLAVVVDDAAQHITQVVRGDDLLFATGRHIHLQRLLGYPTPQYVHVPLVVGPDGERLSKRHGSITLEALAARGIGPDKVLVTLASSIGLEIDRVTSARTLVGTFQLNRLPRSPWVIPEDWQNDHL